MKFLIEDRDRCGLQKQPFPTAYQDKNDCDENWFIDFDDLNSFIKFTTELDYNVVENKEVGINVNTIWDIPVVIFKFKEDLY